MFEYWKLTFVHALTYTIEIHFDITISRVNDKRSVFIITSQQYECTCVNVTGS